MNLVHVKLKNGDDLIGVRDIEENKITKDGIWIISPIHVAVHPIHGLWGKSWMMLSDGNTVKINSNDIMYIANANEKATEWYHTFTNKHAENEATQSLEEHFDEYEDLFTTMLDAKASTKH